MNPVAQTRSVNTGMNERHVWLVTWCPACQALHQWIVERSDSGPLWGWDGNEEEPTLEGSMLVQGGPEGDDYRCHSFLRGGIWDFLDDCTHALRGHHPMQPLPDWLTS